ncbi:hypothetical protein KP509_37G026300 [Ceratopteris richardii]|uniref:Uncharacterized protein n=1 Tax=Ceratopteris richardii TaxID=49495 RepID=A0A8T2Q7J8_CERRI|nr:hypothetical protein KP509_37G026300 [Ceratopteris richardii]
MMSMSSIGSLILRDKGDSRFRHVLKDAGSINSVEYRGMPVPERRHPLSLDEVVVSEKIDDVQKLPIVEELEKKNRHNLQNFFDGVVDLRPLTSVLSPASEVFEADVHWDPKSLLKEVHGATVSSPACTMFAYGLKIQRSFLLRLCQRRN